MKSFTADLDPMNKEDSKVKKESITMPTKSVHTRHHNRIHTQRERH